jgi:hypothetical protein
MVAAVRVAMELLILVVVAAVDVVVMVDLVLLSYVI